MAGTSPEKEPKSKTYRKDLAYVHDVGFGRFARNSATGLLDLLRRHGMTKGLVIDLGCGTGIWAAELSKAGYDVLGIDVSQAMITLAKKKAPKGNFKRASFLQANLPSCVAVTSIGECFNYLFDHQNNIRELARLFRRVFHALAPGGLFVFDFLQPGSGTAVARRDFHEGPDWTVLTKVTPDKNKERLTREITSFRKVGRLYRRGEETHRLLLYRATDLAHALRRIGFRARIVLGYGRLQFVGTHRGIIARKPLL
jgi:SAM-dependent methyltransferase